MRRLWQIARVLFYIYIYRRTTVPLYQIRAEAGAVATTLTYFGKQGITCETLAGLNYAQVEATIEAMAQMERNQREAAIEVLRGAFDDVRLTAGARAA